MTLYYIITLEEKLQVIAAQSIETTGAGGLQINSSTVTNSGIIKDSGTGSLQINSTSITNTGSIEDLDSKTNLDLYNTDIIGGNLETSQGDDIEVSSGAELDGNSAPVTLSIGSNIQINNSSTLTLVGNIVNLNQAQISLNSTGQNTDLILNGTFTPGNIVLTDNGNNRIYSNVAGSVLDNQQTISGSGQIFSNQGLSLINETTGIINSNGSSGLSLGLNITNKGLIYFRRS